VGERRTLNLADATIAHTRAHTSPHYTIDHLYFSSRLLLAVFHSLAVGAAVPHSPTRALLPSLLRTVTTAGAVGVLEELVPLVGAPCLHRDQRASGDLAVLHCGSPLG
jgi:hypothetical protein